MKRILIEIDDRAARDLARVAPTAKRMRAEFIRLAIRSAIDRALDRATADAYARTPVDAGLSATDVVGWDEHNQLATVPRHGLPKGAGANGGRHRRSSAKSAA